LIKNVSRRSTQIVPLINADHGVIKVCDYLRINLRKSARNLLPLQAIWKLSLWASRSRDEMI